MKKLYLLILITALWSCNKVKNKAGSIKEKLKEQVKSKIDNISPKFDHHTPDTENNKKRFKEFLKIEITSDIKNIYCYADMLGADSDFSFSFNCSKPTNQKVIKKHNLVLDSLNQSTGSTSLQHSFPWWNKKHIQTLKKYTFSTPNQQLFKYYWYDPKEEKAYYFEFDL